MDERPRHYPTDSDFVDSTDRTEFCAELPESARPLFSDGLRSLISRLSARYRAELDELLQARVNRQARFNAGELPDFPAETRDVREADWQVAPIPEDLADRRVEITGPVDRKMIINALNSGAKVFMADFEDSSTPTWQNMIDGQVNLHDAVRGDIDFSAPNGKRYELEGDPAVLIVRPRGWHLDEKHVRVDGRPVPGGLFDAAVYVYNNARALIEKGSGPYLYLPKLESRHEAALWERVLSDIEQTLALSPGSIKVTVLIETLPAVFEMDEILHELQHRIVGLNCGRWDYIFSYIKCFQAHSDKVLPDRSQVTMTVPFLRAYSQLLIRTCHRRGAFAMGGMAAQIPIKGDEESNAAALDKVREDKQREAGDGHDGTWVAHPGLIPVAMKIFDEQLGDASNQLHRLREEVSVTASELITPCRGTITEQGVRGNIEVAIRYMAAWLGGQGCVPINHLMEDAATAEIARAQLWQWARHERGVLEDGRDIDLELLGRWQAEALDRIRVDVGDDAFADGHYRAAADLIAEATENDKFIEFLTLPGYERLD